MKTSDWPSLYDRRAGVSDMTEVFSLLDALEHSPSAARHSRLIGAALLILTMMLILATMSLLSRTHERHQAAPVAATDVGHLPVVRKGVLDDLAPASTPNVAAIVTDRQVAASDGDGIPGKPSAHLPALQESATAVSPVSLAKAQFPGRRVKQRRARHSKHRGRRREAVRHRRNVQQGKDGDVDLIAALLSRVARLEPAEVSQLRTRSTATTAPVSTPPNPVSRNKDIVVPQAGVSLAELVRRCRSLGVIEGELCRLRICSGTWGSDPACPATSPGP